MLKEITFVIVLGPVQNKSKLAEQSDKSVKANNVIYKNKIPNINRKKTLSLYHQLEVCLDF